MEDFYNMIPFPYRTDRMGRIRDVITQIRADSERYMAIKQKIEAGFGDDSDIEELQKTKAWLQKEVLAYKRLNSMSMEGIACAVHFICNTQVH